MIPPMLFWGQCSHLYLHTWTCKHHRALPVRADVTRREDHANLLGKVRFALCLDTSLPPPRPLAYTWNQST